MSRPQGSPLFGAPPPPPAVSPTGVSQNKILWRANSFRLTVPGSHAAVAFFASRSLVSAMEIYADGSNASRCVIGNSNVTNELTNPAGVGGNNYFQLDSGRHAYIWTDDPDVEFIDVAQFWACTDDSNGLNQFLHITMWMGQRL
jgi:hypothetical protein